MPNLVNSNEAAEVLGITRRQLLRLVKRGEIVPALKLPGHTGAYLFDPAPLPQLAKELAALRPTRKAAQ